MSNDLGRVTARLIRGGKNINERLTAYHSRPVFEGIPSVELTEDVRTSYVSICTASIFGACIYICLTQSRTVPSRAPLTIISDEQLELQRSASTTYGNFNGLIRKSFILSCSVHHKERSQSRYRPNPNQRVTVLLQFTWLAPYSRATR